LYKIGGLQPIINNFYNNGRYPADAFKKDMVDLGNILLNCAEMDNKHASIPSRLKLVRKNYSLSFFKFLMDLLKGKLEAKDLDKH